MQMQKLGSMGAGDFMHDPTSLITVVALILARVKILFRNVISWFLMKLLPEYLWSGVWNL
jgi:hypothetical protein